MSTTSYYSQEKKWEVQCFEGWPLLVPVLLSVKENEGTILESVCNSWWFRQLFFLLNFVLVSGSFKAPFLHQWNSIQCSYFVSPSQEIVVLAIMLPARNETARINPLEVCSDVTPILFSGA